ncbi:PREDICTED: uncharacterized protein LOC109158030 [Ipomoea nil]|uniref:uncharacterized protein LOC109158030 n=1 Tax=Ipomoea nil TaxID=35883 RepID=UPI000900A3EB|nr:PREDICTED: uncharacterized protein LOC109158030 [Ipomoea nil]
MGFKQAIAENSLFTKGEGKSFVALLVYVDDIVVVSADLKLIQQIKLHLSNNFQIKDLGPLKYFLGLEVARQKNGISVSQRKYDFELLSDAGFMNSKPVYSPTVPFKKFRNENDLLDDNSQYKKLFGKLLYLTITRPDINFATQHLSQFLETPTHLHLQAAHRALRYIKSAPGQGLFFPASSSLKAFTDSDWGACVDTRRSVSGFSVYCDNKSTIAIAENPVFHERTKHIELDCLLIREKLQKGTIRLFHVAYGNQLADVFAKTHCPRSFFSYVSKL